MTKDPAPLRGLVAATFTPFHHDGSINTMAIRPMVDQLLDRGVRGLYVLGSTGEGVSLTDDERRAVAEAFVAASAGRLPVIIHCGSESLRQARLLAAHAQEVGADAVSAISPLYFKPTSVETLVASMAHIASGAPRLPFYYYHIPAVTGLECNLVEFLELGSQQITTLRGIKFTSPQVDELRTCLDSAGSHFDVLWGTDEMLLSGLKAGAEGAIGSTYNFAAPIYHRLLQAWAAGDLEEAARQQARALAMVDTFLPYGSRAAQKAIMSMVGLDCGPTRLPITPLDPSQVDALRTDLQALGFFDWIQDASPPANLS